MKTTYILPTLALFVACALLPENNTYAQNPAPQDSDTSVYDVKSVDRQPAVRGVRANPQYPFELKRAGIEAACVLEFIVNEQGDTENIKAISASDKSWAAACIAAVKQWKFRPAIKNGTPVKCRMQSPFGGILIQGKVTPSKITVLTPKKIDKQPVVSRLSVKYPDALRKAQKTGSVTVQYIITAKGALDDIKITKTKNEDFSKAVTDALAAAKCTPGILDGAPVDCRIQQTVSFDIDNR